MKLYKKSKFSRNFINKRLDKIMLTSNTKQFLLQIAEEIFKMTGNVNLVQRINCIVYTGKIEKE